MGIPHLHHAEVVLDSIRLGVVGVVIPRQAVWGGAGRQGGGAGRQGGRQLGGKAGRGGMQAGGVGRQEAVL